MLHEQGSCRPLCLACSEHTVTKQNYTRKLGWLVGCFGFNGLLRQYFSLY